MENMGLSFVCKGQTSINGRLACLYTVKIGLISIIILGQLACQGPSKRIRGDGTAVLALLQERDTGDLKDVQKHQGASNTTAQVIERFGLPKGQYGYTLVDIASSKVQESFHADEPFVPSSLAKVIPAFAAIKILGPAHRFKTRLYYRGKLKGSVLKGDLFLVGGGEPLLTASNLMDMSTKLYRLGLRKVTGHFYFDESYLVSQPSIELDRDLDEAYNAGISALSSEFNQAQLIWDPAKVAGSLRVELIPDLPEIGLGVLNQTQPMSLTDSLPTWTFRSSGQFNEKVLGGNHVFREFWGFNPTAEQSGGARIPLKHPAMMTASLFRKLSGMLGIALPLAEAKRLPKGSRVLVEHSSKNLAELVGMALEYSNNLMSELLMMSSAEHLDHKKKSMGLAAASVRRWLTRQIPNASWKGFNLVNGSGLGSFNQISAAQTSAVLMSAWNDRSTGPSFISLLPTLGWKGTLLKRHRTSAMAFRAWAKTGTQAYASTIGGYLLGRSGKAFAFTILTGDKNARRDYDLIDVSQGISAEQQKSITSWQARARSFQDALIEHWVESN